MWDNCNWTTIKKKRKKIIKFVILKENDIKWNLETIDRSEKEMISIHEKFKNKWK